MIVMVCLALIFSALSKQKKRLPSVTGKQAPMPDREM